MALRQKGFQFMKNDDRLMRLVARFQSADEAAYQYLVRLKIGRCTTFCGAYGAGLATAGTLAGGDLKCWLALAWLLFMAGLAADNEGPAEEEPAADGDNGGASLNAEKEVPSVVNSI